MHASTGKLFAKIEGKPTFVHSNICDMHNTTSMGYKVYYLYQLLF